ncbi:unnamed protein product [Larinioides sclopetarius]
MKTHNTEQLGQRIKVAIQEITLAIFSGPRCRDAQGGHIDIYSGVPRKRNQNDETDTEKKNAK